VYPIAAGGLGQLSAAAGGRRLDQKLTNPALNSENFSYYIIKFTRGHYLSALLIQNQAERAAIADFYRPSQRLGKNTCFSHPDGGN
jgi:hypothetical protein